MNLLRFLILFSCSALISLLCLKAHAHDVEVIESLDVSRYLGRWYEISKFPNRFQKKCDSDTFADYALMSDGNLSVLNQCKHANGEWENAFGLARQVGGKNSPKLKVRFAPAWLEFIPFVWGDYWVVDLDAQYELAAVSEPKQEYLWILSRSPAVDSMKYAALIQRLKAKGFSTELLETTKHVGN